MDEEKRKSHNVPKSGRKAEKKKNKRSDGTNNVADDSRSRNPKAFALKSAKKAERKFRHKQEYVEKKHHIPLVDRAPIEPPPVVVAVVGPPGSGKSSLIRCLIKNFTRQSLTKVQGPVTIVSSKQRRITLLECNNDLNSMIDIAKVADLALLLVDASYGFEMDTFEFLNICQIHGFPRIMGVLTHLDTIKSVSRQRRVKKILKHRFWTEIYQGAKLFYLSAMKRGSYLKHEVRNLGRYISIMKFRPLQWRSTHPYLVVDRVEDVTKEDEIRLNPKGDRKVCLFGYARGAFFKTGQNAHIPGVGDFCLKHISYLEDPCPIPDSERKRKRSLNEKERIVYAPFSGVGGLVYDKDAVYIDLKGSHSHDENIGDPSDPQVTIVRDLLKSSETINEKMASSSVKLFEGSEPGIADDNSEDGDSELDDGTGSEGDFENQEDNDDEEIFSDMEVEEEHESIFNNNQRRQRRKVDIVDKLDNESNHDDELMFDDENVDDEDISWKQDLSSKASKSFYDRMSQSSNIQRVVYGTNQDMADDDQFDELFDDGLICIRSKKTESGSMKNTINSIESTKFPASDQAGFNWESNDYLEMIRDCFITGKWTDQTDADKILNSDNDSCFDGDYEDLESVGNNTGCLNAEDQPAENLVEKKRKLKKTFDSEYDDKDEKRTFYEEWKSETETQSKLNREEFENMDQETRIKFEGFKPGMYLRIEVDNVPPELLANFDPKYPLIVGGLLPGECMVGYNNIRIKKHRWYKRVLKSRDPLIISMGWRRFQTVALYYIQDTNGRNRSLKYTPQHLHCMASFWGPISPQSTGLIAFKSISDEDRDARNFRIAATGVILHTDKSTVIMKKLKLTGTPLKICKKTAFIKGMFNSSLGEIPNNKNFFV